MTKKWPKNDQNDQNDQKWPKNDHKWPKNDQKWPKMTKNKWETVVEWDFPKQYHSFNLNNCLVLSYSFALK